MVNEDKFIKSQHSVDKNLLVLFTQLLEVSS